MPTALPKEVIFFTLVLYWSQTVIFVLLFEYLEYFVLSAVLMFPLTPVGLSENKTLIYCN